MPIGFFEEGAKDRERKIADLRREHDRRSSVDPIQLPRVDWQGFSDDPIGAGLDALQSTLQGVINRDAQKRAEQRREAEKVAADIYAAHQESNIERTEQEVAEEFYQQTGVSIYTVTRQHARIVGQGNGRIQGRRAVSEMTKRIEAGEFTDPVAFNKAWEEQIGEFDSKQPNRAVKQGYIETLGANRLALEEKVFGLGVNQRKQEALNTAGAELQVAFQDAVVSEDPEQGWTSFGAVTSAAITELRKANPKLTDREVESVYESAVDAELADGMHVGKVDEMVDSILASGVIKTAEGRAELLKRKKLALKQYENELLDPPVEKKAEIEAMIPTMTFDMLKNGKYSDENLKKWYAVTGGSYYGNERLAQNTRALETNLKAQKEGGDSIPTNRKVEFLTALGSGNLAKMEEIVNDPDLIRLAVDDPKGEKWMESAIKTTRDYRRGKLTPAADAEKTTFNWARSVDGLGLDEVGAAEVVEELQIRLANAKDLDVVSANKIAADFRKEKMELNAAQAEEDKNTAAYIIEKVGPRKATSRQANIVLIDIEEQYIAKEEQARKLLAVTNEYNKLKEEKTRTTIGPRQLPMKRSSESEDAKANRIAAEKKRKEVENELIELEAERIKWGEVLKEKSRVERALQGASPEDRVSYMIWTGHHNGWDRTLNYS